MTTAQIPELPVRVACCTCHMLHANSGSPLKEKEVIVKRVLKHAIDENVGNLQFGGILHSSSAASS